MNYEEARSLLVDARGKERATKKLAHNTYLRREGSDFVIRLHATDIITYHADGSITLDSGGWQTVTTKDRFNRFVDGFRVSSEKSVWYLHKIGEWQSPVSAFYDRMTFASDGTMVTEVLVNDDAELRKMKRAIRGYVDLYTNERIAELVEGARAGDHRGDCFFCQMLDTGANDHLLSHIEESYVMVSTIVRALHHVGYNDQQMPFIVRHGDIVRRSLRRYLTERLTKTHGSNPGRERQSDHWNNYAAH